ncbi:hypothetical protein Q7P37_004887 [Cladosporium fusiforme]
MLSEFKDAHRTTGTMAPSPTPEKVPKLEAGIDKPGNAGDAFNVKDENEYASGISLVLLMISLMLGMFLVALDNTILSTAIPKITDEFEDLNQVSWYGAAYFMTFGGFQSTWGKLYKYNPCQNGCSSGHEKRVPRPSQRAQAGHAGLQTPMPTVKRRRLDKGPPKAYVLMPQPPKVPSLMPPPPCTIAPELLLSSPPLSPLFRFTSQVGASPPPPPLPLSSPLFISDTGPSSESEPEQEQEQEQEQKQDPRESLRYKLVVKIHGKGSHSLPLAWESLVSNALVPCINDYREGLVVNLTVHCELASEPAQAPDATQAQAVLVATQKGRVSTTSRQLNEVPAVIAQQAASGDFSHCFVAAEGDFLNNHFPLIPAVLVPWYAEIRAGNADVERPSHNVVLKMKTATALQEARREKESRQKGAIGSGVSEGTSKRRLSHGGLPQLLFHFNQNIFNGANTLHIKLWYLISILIFQVGSIVCAVAKNPTTLIVGRAIQGVGGSGVTVGLFCIVAFATPPAKRPQYLGMVGAMYVIAAVMSPLLGGAFTQRLTWRWCFWINLPKSSTVIGLLVGFVLLLPVFIAWELFQQEYAMIVPRIFAKRYNWSGAFFMVFFSGSYFVILYYLPIYFQSVHNATPIGSGVRMLALIIPLTFAAIAQGFAFTRIGIVPVFWLIGGSLGAIGSGLFYTMDEATGTGKWIGFQIIVGSAVGLTTQVALQNAQVQVSFEDLSQATAIINFCLTVGGSFFISAAQCGFNNQLIKHFIENLPDLNPALALSTGATQIRTASTPEQVPIVISGYITGLQTVFVITTAAFGFAVVVGLLGSWKKLSAEDIKRVQIGA